MTSHVRASLPTSHEIDSAAIRLGGTFRLPARPKAPAETADSGRIRLGGTFRLV